MCRLSPDAAQAECDDTHSVSKKSFTIELQTTFFLNKADESFSFGH